MVSIIKIESTGLSFRVNDEVLIEFERRSRTSCSKVFIISKKEIGKVRLGDNRVMVAFASNAASVGAASDVGFVSVSSAWAFVMVAFDRRFVP